MAEKDMGNAGEKQTRVPRRSWLKYSLGGAATTLLAGCSGNNEGGDSGDDGDGGTTNTGSSGILDRTMKQSIYVSPANTNLNPFNPQSNWHTRFYSNRLLSRFDPTRGELSAKNGIGMAKNWGYRTTDGTPEFFVEIKDDWKWSVGPEGDSSLDSTEVLAEDIVRQRKLSRLMIPAEERSDEPVVSDWYADGDKTVVSELTEGKYNKTAQKFNALTNWFWVQVHRDGPLGASLERLQDASGEGARSSIRQEVIQDTELGNILKKPVSGPWRPIEVDNQRLRYELNTDDKAAATQGGSLNFSNFELVWLGDTSHVRAMGQNQIDMAEEPVPRAATVPDNLHEVDAQELGGSLLHIRYFPEDSEKTFMNKPKFRWAIAHVIDRAQAAKNAGRLVEPVNKQTAAEDSQAETQMPNLYPKLRSYDKDADQAAQYLEDIGCTKNGEKWMDPNGNRLTIPIVSKNIALWEPQANTIASNLQNFGIKVELSLKDETTADAQMERHDFTAGMYKWGGFAYYPLNFIDHGWQLSGTSNERTTTPDVLTAPDPIGDWESSDMMEVNGPELFNKVQRTSDTDEAQQMIKKLCWAHNYNLPFLQIGSSGSGTPLNMNGKWNWPEFEQGKGSGPDWATSIDENDDPVLAVDSPQTAIFKGNGDGLRANPDYNG